MVSFRHGLIIMFIVEVRLGCFVLRVVVPLLVSEAPRYQCLVVCVYGLPSVVDSDVLFSIGLFSELHISLSLVVLFQINEVCF